MALPHVTGEMVHAYDTDAPDKETVDRVVQEYQAIYDIDIWGEDPRVFDFLVTARLYGAARAFMNLIATIHDEQNQENKA